VFAQYAQDYAQKAFSVIPLKAKDKKALGPWKKYQHEKAIPAQLESWWENHPRANVGIVTGKISGIIVIDCDSKEACERFVKDYPEAEETLQSRTGRGKHFYFEWAAGIRNKAGTVLGRGVDVKSDGGYVVAPPSIHKNGKRYTWLNDARIQLLPRKLKEALTISSKRHATSQTRKSPKQKEVIKEGERNSRLTSIAGAMQRQGVNRDAILNALVSENSARCDPRLSDDELEGIVESVSRYAVPGKSEELTDAGNARRFAAHHRDEVRYCHKWKLWLIWDGTRWRRDENGIAISKAKETAKAIYTEASLAADEKSRKKLSKHAMRSEGAWSIRNMVFLAQSERGIATTPSELDSDAWLLNVKNGTLDLKRGKIGPHNKEHLITKLAPVNYSPDAKCPQWDKFLRQIMDGKEELICFLQRAIGWSLTGDVSEQKLFFLFGKGANGKSTFLNIIREMLGDYAKQAAPELLLKKTGSSHPTEIADLQGSRFVVAVEVDEGRHFAEALLKQLTGGDKIKARRLYQDFDEFDPTHKLFLAANHKPNVGDGDAIWRRLCVVPFTVSIPEQEQDKDLLNKLRKEFPGILAWAVRGCLEWQKRGLKPPSAVVSATNSYKAEMDVIERFLTEQCTKAAKEKVKVSTLFDAFTEWCNQNGETLRLNSRDFSARLQNREFTTKHTNKGNVWIGIALNEEEDIAA
jgi:putative DNA primase/helicase